MLIKGLDRIQASIGGLIAAIAAPAAFVIAPEGKWLAVACGAIGGFILGVIGFGAFIAIFPVRIQLHRVVLSRDEYLARNRKLKVAGCAYFAVVPITICLFALGLVAIAITVHALAYLLTMALWSRLLSIACPNCGEDFGIHSAFNAEEHVCSSCGRGH